jgi:hypothetical protein
MASSFWKNFMVAGTALNRQKALDNKQNTAELAAIDNMLKKAKQEKDESALKQAMFELQKLTGTREQEKYEYGVSQRPAEEKKSQAELDRINADVTATKNKLSPSALAWEEAVRKGEKSRTSVPQSIRDEISTKAGYDIYEIAAEPGYEPEFRDVIKNGKVVTLVRRKPGGQWEDADMTKYGNAPGGGGGVLPGFGDGQVFSPGQVGGDSEMIPRIATNPPGAPQKGNKWQSSWRYSVDKDGNPSYTQEWNEVNIPAPPKPAAKPAKKDVYGRAGKDKSEFEASYKRAQSAIQGMKTGQTYRYSDFSPMAQDALSGLIDVNKKGEFKMSGAIKAQALRKLHNDNLSKGFKAKPAPGAVAPKKKKKPGNDLSF